jgi:hypothetical protein
MASSGAVDAPPTPPSSFRPRPRPLIPKSQLPQASQSAPSCTTISLDRGSRDNAISIDSDSEGSELTPLPSPLEEQGNAPAQITKENSHPSLGSVHAVPVTPGLHVAPHLVDLDPWSVEKLGSYVWVLLDPHARVFEPGDAEDASQCDKERLWWPGKVCIFVLSDCEDN